MGDRKVVLRRSSASLFFIENLSCNYAVLHLENITSIHFAEEITRSEVTKLELLGDQMAFL
jgi:hypothetical protein